MVQDVNTLELQWLKKIVMFSYRVCEYWTCQHVLLPVCGPRVLVGGHGAFVLLLVPPAVRVHCVQAVAFTREPVTSKQI